MVQVSDSERSSSSHTGHGPHQNGPHQNGSPTCTFDRKCQEVEATQSIPHGMKYGGGSSNGGACTGGGGVDIDGLSCARALCFTFKRA